MLVVIVRPHESDQTRILDPVAQPGGSKGSAGPPKCLEGPALAAGPALTSAILFIFIFGGGPLAAKLLQ